MRKFTTIIAGALFLMGWSTLFTSPAWAQAKVSITGSVRFNAIFSDRIYAGGTQSIAPGNIPFDSGPKAEKERDHRETILDARRSRIQIDISDTAPGNITLAGRIQADFDTSDGNALTSNSRHLRLRLAYGQASLPNGFTLRAGQARTIVSEFGDNLIGGVGVAEVINENDYFDQLQARQPALQVAWTSKMGGGDLTVGAGVEKQAVGVKSRTGLSTVVDERQGEGQDVPLIGAGVRYRSPLFSVFARGAAAKARVILSGTGKDEDEAVWLAAISAEVKPTAMLTLVGQYWVSNGLNRINGTFNDVALVNGKLEGVEAQAFHVGAQLRLTKDVRFNAVYQWMKADDNAKIFDLTASSGDKEKFQAINLNVIYAFWARWDAGLEYMHAKVESFGDSDGTINIVNFRLRFNF